MTVTAYEHIVQLHEISLVQDEWQYPVQEHAEHARSPNWSPIFITYSDDFSSMLAWSRRYILIRSETLWDHCELIMSHSLSTHGKIPSKSIPVEGTLKGFSHGCGRGGIFPEFQCCIHLKTCPKTRLFMSHSIGQSKELEFALAPSSVVIMEATDSKFSTIITYLCLLILIVCNIISTSILNRVRWKQALNIYFEFT